MIDAPSGKKRPRHKSFPSPGFWFWARRWDPVAVYDLTHARACVGLARYARVETGERGCLAGFTVCRHDGCSRLT